jgi:hypothetical protein
VFEQISFNRRFTFCSLLIISTSLPRLHAMTKIRTMIWSGKSFKWIGLLCKQSLHLQCNLYSVAQERISITMYRMGTHYVTPGFKILGSEVQNWNSSAGLALRRMRSDMGENAEFLETMRRIVHYPPKEKAAMLYKAIGPVIRSCLI